MKKIVIFILTAFFSAGAFAATPIPPDRVEVYYFHGTHRSKTCTNVENVSRNAILTLYPVKVKRAEIFFKSINLDEKEGAALAAKLHIKGRTLIVIRQEKRVDLTKKAFKYASDHPDKLTEEIKNAVEGLLK